MAHGERRTSLLAAQWLDSFDVAQAVLLKMRDDKVEPEASEARRILKIVGVMQRMAARPRPWDGEEPAP